MSSEERLPESQLRDTRLVCLTGARMRRFIRELDASRKKIKQNGRKSVILKRVVEADPDYAEGLMGDGLV